MKSLIAALLVLSLPVATLGGNHFCQQKVVVQKQVVAHQVYGYGHAFQQQYYYAPVGQYSSYRTKEEIADEAIERLADKLAQRLGIQQQGLTVSVIDNKCANCHRSDANGAAADEARAMWEFASVPLGWKDAARAQDGLVNHDMATRAKLTDEEQNQIVVELTGYLNEAAKTQQPELNK